METPKRTHKPQKKFESHGYLQYRRCTELARWSRKNKTRQLKHTIAILTERLKDTEEALVWTQKITKCYLVRPNHWHHLGPDGRQYTRKQWMKEMKSRNEKR